MDARVIHGTVPIPIPLARPFHLPMPMPDPFGRSAGRTFPRGSTRVAGGSSFRGPAAHGAGPPSNSPCDASH